MKTILKHLWLLSLLILATSGILLMSDASHRENRTKSGTAQPSIAIVQYSSTPLLDEHVRGVIAELERQGCLKRNHQNLRVLNAQGDNTMAASIAREVVEGQYDILITSSTMSLQSIANANRNKRKPHIFGAVTDPYGTGVGITGTEPDNHPAHLAGIGTFQPVTELFKVAKSLNPDLQRVGVLWNPAEQCSAACLRKARAICKELKIELIEVNANNASEVSEALRSLLSKNVEAVWIGGDTVATGAAKFMIQKSGESNVPVITNDPADVGQGALIGLGANYYTVGEYTGKLAAEIIRGRSPASVAIKNVVPEKLNVNQTLLDQLDGWNMNSAIQQRIAVDKSTHETAQIALINLVHAPGLDAAEKGILDALKQQGTDYKLIRFNAQGDASLISQQIKSALASDPDLVLTLTTPVMLAAAKQIKEVPVVFTVASNPRDLGVKVPDNLCGVYEDLSAAQLLEMIQRRQPGLQKIGALYDPSQPNAVLAADALKAEAKKAHIECIDCTVFAVAELNMATRSLIQKGAEAVVIGSDNLTSSGFPAIIKAANALNTPVYTNEPSLVDQGAAGAVGCDYYAWGFQAGQMIARILSGTRPDQLGLEAQTKKAAREASE